MRPCVSGPKRPQDRILLKNVKKDWNKCIINKAGFKGFGVKPEEVSKKGKLIFEGKEYTLEHGSLVIAAIASCTNTANPDAMIQAGLLAKKAVKKGLLVKPYIKTSVSPGSGVV